VTTTAGTVQQKHPSSIATIWQLFLLLRLLLSSRAALIAENLFLRKQLALCQERSVKSQKATPTLRLSMIVLGAGHLYQMASKCISAVLAMEVPKARSSLVPQNLREMIRMMDLENPTWGEERIAGELLLKFGIRVSPRTVRKYLASGPHRCPRGDQR
jgi:hypothetical protein